MMNGILLCGGKSSRMGSDKGMVNYKGRPLILYGFEVLKSSTSKIYLSSNTNRYQFLECEIVPDEIHGIGPVGGIYSCLKQSSTDLNLVLSCDTPRVTSSFLSFLIQSYENGFDVILPSHNGNIEPLVALYHKNLLPHLEREINTGNYALSSILNKVERVKHLSCERQIEENHQLFLNINNPSELI
jgi:molybdopterin-guanine dinucleotide biosynthesis protein A